MFLWRNNIVRIIIHTRARDKKGYWGLFKDNFSYFSTKTYVVTHHQNRLAETVHNICFKGEIWKNIPKLSFLPLVIRSTDSYLYYFELCNMKWCVSVALCHYYVHVYLYSVFIFFSSLWFMNAYVQLSVFVDVLCFRNFCRMFWEQIYCSVPLSLSFHRYSVFGFSSLQ